jgi:hypothetical protein
MIDLAKKLSDSIIDNTKLSYRNERGDYVNFVPDDDSVFARNIQFRLEVWLDLEELNTQDNMAICQGCDGDVSMVVAAFCNHTNFTDSSSPQVLDFRQREYIFDFYLKSGSVFRDFSLNLMVFYSGKSILQKFNYWPGISLLKKNIGAWNFSQLATRMFKVARTKGKGTKLVNLCLDNVFSLLDCDFEDVEYFAVIDVNCFDENMNSEKYIMCRVLYEYIEFLVFKNDLAEKLISGIFDSDSVGKNMQLFLESFMNRDGNNPSNFSLINIEKFRSDLMFFKREVDQFILKVICDV